MAEPATKLPIKGETYEPGSPQSELAGFDRFWSEMDRLFDNFGFRSGRRPFAAPLSFDLSLPRFERWGSVPAVDVSKTDELYNITAELPGIAPADVQVKLSDGLLTISGEKKSEKERKDEDAYVSERRYGSFFRSFRLPDDIVADKIEARYANGVLSIAVPRRVKAQPKEEVIPVKAA
ncbi:Hsp20/alpha crystallin family protein (plasmid) [Bosea sp. F3-2]|uniref:Hsp20/alpha crystallin family protein n=1 Tax=Bosea sp. F3-2 TaxID=2599640 RepID=UPI0011EF2988|nr:Hsp20/alpha crystallin family protein [Bosea sp. F3-2]QEL27243.1 Hsp20/alpha crystallin family protein [Bosea sp. F3-2]